MQRTIEWTKTRSLLEYELGNSGKESKPKMISYHFWCASPGPRGQLRRPSSRIARPLPRADPTRATSGAEIPRPSDRALSSCRGKSWNPCGSACVSRSLSFRVFRACHLVGDSMRWSCIGYCMACRGVFRVLCRAALTADKARTSPSHPRRLQDVKTSERLSDLGRETGERRRIA